MLLGNDGRFLLERYARLGRPLGGRCVQPRPVLGAFCALLRTAHILPTIKLLSPLPRAVWDAVRKPTLGCRGADRVIAGERDDCVTGTVTADELQTYQCTMSPRVTIQPIGCNLLCHNIVQICGISWLLVVKFSFWVQHECEGEIVG